MRGMKHIWVVVVVMSGLWGCAKGPASQQTTAEKLKTLETKMTKLEDDFRVSVAAREQLRKKLTTTEDERANLLLQIEQLQTVVKERDQLRLQLVSRTTERDSVVVQIDQLRKGMRTLLGQADTSVSSIPAPVTSISVTPSGS